MNDLKPWQQLVADAAREIDPGSGEFVHRSVVVQVPRRSGFAGQTRLLSAAEAERYLGVAARRVRVWKHRGLLHASGVDSSGRPLYKEANILALAAADTPSSERLHTPRPTS